MSLALPHATAGYALRLTIGRLHAQVHLEGAIDVAAAPDLSKLMNSLDRLVSMAVDIDLSAVTFLDTHGVRPLIDATRRRRRDQLPPVAISECSPRARWFLKVSGLDGQPHLDLAAWDRKARPRINPVLPPKDSAAEKRPT
jgi:anti-anti-sigma regulatory factor